MTMISPGPLTFQNRPSWKMTPRSYSRRILMALMMMPSKANAMMPKKYSNMILLLH